LRFTSFAMVNSRVDLILQGRAHVERTIENPAEAGLEGGVIIVVCFCFLALQENLWVRL
jgi:hypothetical protein